MNNRIAAIFDYIRMAALMVSVPTDRSNDDERDRGDVPGWVMITVMTAIVVIALLGIFRTQVTSAITDAFESVRGSGGTGK